MPAVAAARDLTVPSDGLSIFVHVRTAAHPKGTIVVIHGGPGISHEYTRPIEALVADGYTVAEYDQRGAGRSGAPADPTAQGFEKHVPDLEAVRVALGAERIDVVAHSYGGLIALAYAILQPTRVRSMIFVDSMPPAFGDYLAGQMYFTETMSKLQREGLVAKDIPDNVGNDCSKGLIAMLPVYYFDPKHPASANLAGSSCSASAFTAMTEANASYDFTPYLDRITVPTLVVQGEADPFRKQMADALMTGLVSANPKLAMLPRCGHLPWEECPEPFFAAVRAFLASRP